MSTYATRRNLDSNTQQGSCGHDIDKLTELVERNANLSGHDIKEEGTGYAGGPSSSADHDGLSQVVHRAEGEERNVVACQWDFDAGLERQLQGPLLLLLGLRRMAAQVPRSSGGLSAPRTCLRITPSFIVSPMLIVTGGVMEQDAENPAGA